MRIKKTANISLRVTYYFKEQLKLWSVRSGMTYSDFLLMALLKGARLLAMELGVFEKNDNWEEEDVKAWHLVEGSWR